MDFLRSHPWRIEDKFGVPLLRTSELLSRLRRDGCVDSHAKPDGSYNVLNLYYDSRDRSCYQSYKSGLQRRFKCRLRSYDSMGSCQLELKLKVDRLSRKFCAPFSQSQAIDPISTPLLQCLSPEERRQLQAFRLYPSAYTRYNRYAYRIENFRLTLDLDLAFAPASSPDMFRKVEDCVLEVKGMGDYPETIKKILLSHGLVKSSYSKYARAIEELNLA